MKIKNITDFFKKHALFKLIIALILGSFLIFQNSPKIRENIFYFIETHIFYRDIPPIYDKDSFKSMEPNSVCQSMKDDRLITSSYIRNHNFDFSCESITLVAADSSWNIQFLVSGKLFNANTIILKMEFLKEEEKYDNVKEMIPFVEHLFSELGYGKMPETFRQGLYSLNNEDTKLDDNVSVKLVSSSESISLIFY